MSGLPKGDVFGVLIFHRQPGQTSADEVAKRDLRAELLLAEAEARDKKRKAEGKPPLGIENGQDEQGNKRRKLLQDAIELDKDEDDEDGEDKGEKEDGDNDEDDECVRLTSVTCECVLMWERCLPGMTRMTKRMMQQSSCESWRRLSGNVQRRRRGRSVNSRRSRRQSGSQRSQQQIHSLTSQQH